MKDRIPVVTVGLGLAGLILALHTQTRSQIERLDVRLATRIETLDERIYELNGRVYELNERLTRVETRIIEAVQP